MSIFSKYCTKLAVITCKDAFQEYSSVVRKQNALVSCYLYICTSVHIKCSKVPSARHRDTVFPRIVSAETILFRKLECGNYSREETIQGRKLLFSYFFEAETILGNLNSCRKENERAVEKLIDK